MVVLNEGRHDGEFIVSEANGARSREVVTVAAGQNLAAGTVLEGPDTAVTGFSGDTSDVATGILFRAVDATAAAISGEVAIVRDAEVNLAEISVPSDDTAETIKAAAVVSLALLGIIAR